VKELAKSNYKGVTATIAFTKNGEMQTPAITLYHYIDGKKNPLN
jgi:branched-chain amino acid transport system substrate-binding protein